MKEIAVMCVPPEHNFYLTQLSDLSNGVFFYVGRFTNQKFYSRGTTFSQFLSQKIAPNQWRVRFIHRWFASLIHCCFRLSAACNAILSRPSLFRENVNIWKHFSQYVFIPIGHDLGQRVRIIQKRNRCWFENPLLKSFLLWFYGISGEDFAIGSFL